MLSNYTSLSTSLRILCAEMVETAQSGHPGMPLGIADVATVLWKDFLKHNPKDPTWHDRDRFILSAGHGSTLLYALLYLTGYSDTTLDKLKNFRQLHSGTAGHPEYGELAGIETTTGPLGQGLANAVGMAIAEKKLSTEFGQDLVNHKTYCIVGDGCLMEGISQEAISLAGHLKLKNLVVIWDNNEITIDGPTLLSTSEDQISRFKASGWNVIEIDGHNHDAIHAAFMTSNLAQTPTLIAAKTTIGWGAPSKQGTAKAHGSPLGTEELKQLKALLNWTFQPFEVPESILNTWRTLTTNVSTKYATWKDCHNHSSQRSKFNSWHATSIDENAINPLNFLKKTLIDNNVSEASRKTSEHCLTALYSAIPNLIGGSADLSPSNNTRTSTMSAVSPNDFSGNYLHYGVREHAMAAIMNGISLHKGLIPYSGTFLCFSDYAKPAIRLSALMKLPIIYVMTHDSIGLGEDGPTHQPIEHLATLRCIPNINVFRPCDSIETAECWELAITSKTTPSILALSRQTLPLVRKQATQNLSSKGAYVIKESESNHTLTLIASGSEVNLAIDVAQNIEQKFNHGVAVVSMPSWYLFEQQSNTYQRHVLGTATKVSIEAASTFGWKKWADHSIGIDTFGASAPASDLYQYFGLTVENITHTCLNLLSNGETK